MYQRSSSMDPSAATLIVIPTYNERELLPQIVPAVRAAGRKPRLDRGRIVSATGTGEVATSCLVR